VVALSAQQLCLGKVGNPLNFGADPCCHGNEIWPRRGDLDAYQLVLFCLTDATDKAASREEKRRERSESHEHRGRENGENV